MQKSYMTPQMEVVNFTLNEVIAYGEYDFNANIVTPQLGSN